MKNFDYLYLADYLEHNGTNPAGNAEAALAITKMVKEIQHLQSLVYLKPSQITSFGVYEMFRTDDEGSEGIKCLIAQGPENTFYLLGDGTPSSVECQNILTLDEEVRFKKCR